MTAFLAFLGDGRWRRLGRGRVWLGRRVRRRGVGGEVMGSFEEIWNPAAHRARLEIEVQEERMVPLPSPDDQ